MKTLDVTIPQTSFRWSKHLLQHHQVSSIGELDDLMGLISDFTGGLVEMKSGTAYSELRRLETQGLVESKQEKEGRKRRSYVITSSGEEELVQLASQMRVRVDSILKPLLSLIE